MINPKEIITAVERSLAEDIGSGDITAALIAKNAFADAYVMTRETAVICGQAWFAETFKQLDPSITLKWHAKEGERVLANTKIVSLAGPARALLTGERTALNWLQTLSGTATSVADYVDALAGLKTQLLDTRKTIPGLRDAQKYAVTVGGATNHRHGLYDMYLIKENHIASCGSITLAVQTAKAQHADKKIEVEVENLTQLEEAILAKADIVMLDNFDLSGMRQAVELTQGRVKLEVSGNVSLETIAAIAKTGVDFISVGAITKHLRAIDLSMRFV